MGKYANFVTKYPWAVILIDMILVMICGPIGIWQGGIPDFSDPRKGFEPRGTRIRGQDFASTRFQIRLLRGNFTTVTEVKRESPPDITSNQTANGTMNTLCSNQHLVSVVARALPPALRAQQELSELPALPRMVIEPKDKSQSLWTPEYMKAICDLEQKYVTSFLKTTCPAHSLPFYIGLLQNKTCSDIDQTDMDEVLDLLQRCLPFYSDGKLPCDNMTCVGVPEECYQYNASFYMLEYFTDTKFFENGDRTKTHLSYSLIIFRRSWNIGPDELFDYYLKELEDRPVENDIIEVKAMDMDLIFTLINTHYIREDLPYYGLAMALVLIALFLYLRSFALMGIVILIVGLTLFVAYFIYFVIFRLVYFGFTNLLAGLLLIAIGADDVFICYDIWHKIKSEAPDPQTIDIEELTDHTLRHAALSILVTSLTTAAALLANGISEIVALRCFGIFGAICIMVNLFFMVTLVPSVLVLLEKMNRKQPWCQCKGTDGCITRMHKLSSFIWEKVIPVVIIKGAMVWVVIFLALGISGFIIVFYKPKFDLPVTESFQSFYDEHPFEVYRFQHRDTFRFEIKNQEISKVNIYLNFVFGVDGEDNGDVLDPDDTGVFRLDPKFSMYPKENQVWLKSFCHDLLQNELVLDTGFYTCFMDRYESVLTGDCQYDQYNISLNQPCCMSSFPLSPADAEKCLNNGDFLQVVVNGRNNTTSLIGQPVFDQDGHLVATYFQVKTAEFWTPVYDIMNNYYLNFTRFMENQLKEAPKSFKGGWFSGAFGREFFYYDLQRVMILGVIYGLVLAMAVAFFIMLITSQNFFITLYAIFTIILVIVDTVAIFVLLGWELAVTEALVITLTAGLSIDFAIHFGVAYKVSPKKTRVDKTKDGVGTVGFAVTMAALTTFLAGLALLFGRIVSYYKFGLFLMLDMVVSWLFALFFFMPLCSLIGPVGAFGDLSVLLHKPFAGRKNKTGNEISDQLNKQDSNTSNIYVVDDIKNGKTDEAEKVNTTQNNNLNDNAHIDGEESNRVNIVIVM